MVRLPGIIPESGRERERRMEGKKGWNGDVLVRNAWTIGPFGSATGMFSQLRINS